MVREIRILGLTVSALLLPALAVAQAGCPQDRADLNAFARSDTLTTVGKGGEVDTQHDATRNLGDKLARSGGVICPPEHVDPEIKQSTPPCGAKPVIPQPGSPGGDQSIHPK
jgi:hypothetical protein